MVFNYFYNFKNLSKAKSPYFLPGAIISFLFLFALNLQAQDMYENKKTTKIKHRLSAGPAISYFKNHPQHTINTKAKAGFNATYKAEVLLGRRTNFLIGLEYLSQGVKFNGYYSAPGHTYLYDLTFPYQHEIRYQELQLPLGFKTAFNREKDNSYTPYYFLEVGFRYVYKATVYIESDSTHNAVYEGKTNLTFENDVIDRKINAFFMGGLGVQKNFRGKKNSGFLEFTYKYGISRLHYTGYQNSNNLNIKDANLAITIGMRF